MARVYNFSAGPSVLPESVLRTAAEEMLDYKGSGQSVMEMSHRSKTYDAIIKECEALLREVMGVPGQLQGPVSAGGRLLPVCHGAPQSDERQRQGRISCLPVSGPPKLSRRQPGTVRPMWSPAPRIRPIRTYPRWIPPPSPPDADYFHICLNNTIYGTRFTALPETGDVPLVADVSSCILSEPIDVSRFGLLYAGAQKKYGARRPDRCHCA